ncbi:MAG: hypothetical protein KGN39_01720 [Betaproteobacteria bacterium]|nr:hypothetical protein [Betaproteobacteria bacterium]
MEQEELKRLLSGVSPLLDLAILHHRLKFHSMLPKSFLLFDGAMAQLRTEPKSSLLLTERLGNFYYRGVLLHIRSRQDYLMMENIQSKLEFI